MMQIFTVTCFGHRRISDPITLEHNLEAIVCQLLDSKEYVDFLLGRDGDFDLMAAAVIKRCQRKFRTDNSSITWVLPYSKAELTRNADAFAQYYDRIEIMETPCHRKAAYQKRNESMVDRADMVLLWVEHAHGGAYRAMRYAEKQGKETVLLVPKNNSLF